MFDLFYLKLKRVYNSIWKSYAVIILDKPHWFILFYIIISTLLSFGLLNLKFNLDTDSLSYVRDSETLRDAKILNKTFTYDATKRHFLNKLLDLGNYVEIIATVRDPNGKQRKSNMDLLEPEFNMINRTVLDEFNQLYDEVINIEIEDLEEVLEFNSTLNKETKTVQKKTYKYVDDLCAKRLMKCSIEEDCFVETNSKKDY